MSRSIEIAFAFLATFCLFNMVSGHSQMMCAKYDTKTQECVGGLPRNAGYTYVSESYVWTSGADICQYPWASPITSYYGNGSSCPDWAPCPTPMGTYAPGESFTIMWYGRNHDEDDQIPGDIYLYMSPIESVNQGSDVSVATMKEHLLCSGPFENCEGPNGNTVHCTLSCTMPTNTASGYYTLWWYWPWADNDTDYATCADILVTGSGSGSGTSTSTSTTSKSSSSSSTTSKSSTTTSSSSSKASTTAKANLTTGKKTTTTTAKATTTTTSTSTTAPAPVPVHTTTTTTTTTSTSTTGTTAPAPIHTTTTTTTSTSAAATSCTSRDMKCETSETYQTCANGIWGSAQSCQTGQTCHPSGNVIYCY